MGPQKTTTTGGAWGNEVHNLYSVGEDEEEDTSTSENPPEDPAHGSDVEEGTEQK